MDTGLLNAGGENIYMVEMYFDSDFFIFLSLFLIEERGTWIQFGPTKFGNSLLKGSRRDSCLRIRFLTSNEKKNNHRRT